MIDLCCQKASKKGKDNGIISMRRLYVGLIYSVYLLKHDRKRQCRINDVFCCDVISNSREVDLT